MWCHHETGVDSKVTPPIIIMNEKEILKGLKDLKVILENSHLSSSSIIKIARDRLELILEQTNKKKLKAW